VTKPKNRYKLTVDNQLAVITSRSGRIVLPGRFVLEDGNRLSYIVAGTARRLIHFRGIWSLKDERTLQFTLFETKRHAGGDVLYFKGTIKAVTPRSLYYRSDGLPEPARAGGKPTCFTLRGRWQADEYNRLTFLVERGSAQYDRLTFRGTWETKHNTLVYRYTRKSLKTRAKVEQSIEFKGFWDIGARERISYVLDAAANSSFSFKIQLESPNLAGKDGAITYRVGVGIGHAHRLRINTIVLYGTWKLGNEGGISFEMEYGKGNYRRIEFETFLKISERNTIGVGLKNRQGEDLGITVCFRRTFFRNKAAWFLRGSQSGQDSRIEAGVSIPW